MSRRERANPAVSFDSKPNPLARRLEELTRGLSRLETAVPGLLLFRDEHPSGPRLSNLPPCVCLIGQGAKSVMIGEAFLVYDAVRFLVTSVDLPLVTQVLKASPEEPYLALALTLDRRLVTELILEEGARPDDGGSQLGAAVSDLTPPLSEAFLRLLALLDAPDDLPVLAPLILKEITYRLLKSEQGSRLAQIAAAPGEGRFSGIDRAIAWLKSNFDQPVQVPALAASVGMSASSFHQRFRAVTALSPIQYQKRLRLIEARRLMLEERLDASGAAYRVGYESPSQFSREYSRLFGTPPAKDLRLLRG
jgi:AraC-like DNA-binding protein